MHGAEARVSRDHPSTSLDWQREAREQDMNKFRKLGLIEYNGELKVHSALLNVIIHD
jgi:CRP/FNR family transcriptional regulator, cyclic AMP receptor protein